MKAGRFTFQVRGSVAVFMSDEEDEKVWRDPQKRAAALAQTTLPKIGEKHEAFGFPLYVSGYTFRPLQGVRGCNSEIQCGYAVMIEYSDKPIETEKQAEPTSQTWRDKPPLL